MKSLNNLKFLQVSASLDPKLGGPHNVVEQTSRLFASRYKLSLTVFGSSTLSAPYVHTQATTFNNRFGFALKLPTKQQDLVLRDADILLIHGFYLWSTLIALKFSKTHNIFLMPHGSLEKYQQKKGRLRKYLFKTIFIFLLKSRSIHFLVGSTSETISVKEIFPNYPISVVGLGIQSNIEKNVESQTHEPITLFCMSRIAHKKRIDLCIEALSNLSQRNKYKLNIYGSGEKSLENELKDLANTLQVSNLVSFEGHVDGISKTLAVKSSDILLLPSENENFAVAVAESIAFGKPVIVSKFVAMHQFVDDHETGITINALEVDQIVAAIEKISMNFSKYQRNCFKSAHLLDWDEVIKRWYEVIENNLVENA